MEDRELISCEHKGEVSLFFLATSQGPVLAPVDCLQFLTMWSPHAGELTSTFMREFLFFFRFATYCLTVYHSSKSVINACIYLKSLLSKVNTVSKGVLIIFHSDLLIFLSYHLKSSLNDLLFFFSYSHLIPKTMPHLWK